MSSDKDTEVHKSLDLWIQDNVDTCWTIPEIQYILKDCNIEEKMGLKLLLLTDMDGNTALHRAALAKREDLLDERTPTGSDILAYSVRNNNSDTVYHLVANISMYKV